MPDLPLRLLQPRLAGVYGPHAGRGTLRRLDRAGPPRRAPGTVIRRLRAAARRPASALKWSFACAPHDGEYLWVFGAGAPRIHRTASSWVTSFPASISTIASARTGTPGSSRLWRMQPTPGSGTGTCYRRRASSSRGTHQFWATSRANFARIRHLDRAWSIPTIARLISERARSKSACTAAASSTGVPPAQEERRVHLGSEQEQSHRVDARRQHRPNRRHDHRHHRAPKAGRAVLPGTAARQHRPLGRRCGARFQQPAHGHQRVRAMMLRWTCSG